MKNNSRLSYYYYKLYSLDLFLHKVNIENNQIDINNRKSVIESETDIRNYIYNRITMFFNRDKSIKCDDNIKRYLWITLSASWTILLFGGKFIIDIINIFTDEYKFGINFCNGLCYI